MNNSPIANRRCLTTKVVAILCGYAASFALLCFVQPVNAQSSVGFIETINRAKKTVAPVVCMARDAAAGTQFLKFRVFGTAFMVDSNGTFITANHVLNEFRNSPWNLSCIPAVIFPVGGWKRESQETKWFTFDGVKCQVNEHWDVAVCKTRLDLSKETTISYEVANISKERPADGTSVFFTGFPLQADDPITSIGAVAGFTSSDAYNTILVDKNAWPGASGSPIVLANGGNVVGMLTRTGVGDAAGISFGIAGERLVNILSNARSNWAKEENKPPEKQ